MSLLARRRSSQAVVQKNDEPPMTVSTLPVPAMPDDYDPRIRGKIVHDFSAPRPRRQYSGEGVPASTSNRRPSAQQYQSESWRPESHTRPYVHDERQNSKSPEKAPLFTEHFNDDRPVLNPESKGYLHSLAASSFIPRPDHEPPAIPAFARGLPMRLPDTEDVSRKRLLSLSGSQIAPVPRPLPQSPPPNAVEAVPPPRTVRPPSGEVTAQASNLPKHMTSNSSRFSFDLSGLGSSAQEKLLEEKHKQKQAARKAIFGDIDDDDAAELDNYANYGFDDYDDLEEKIPGVNVDAEDDLEEEIPGVNVDTTDVQIHGVNTEAEVDQGDHTMPVSAGLQHFHFTPSVPSTIMSPTTAGSGQTSFPTPRDDQGQAIGYAMSKESPDIRQQSPSFYQLSHPHTSLELIHGLGISSVPNGPQEEKPKAHDLPAQTFSEDEMYFDDGDIQLGADDSGSASFDESIFDNEAAGILDIPAQNARNLEAAQARGLQHQTILTNASAHTSFDQAMTEAASEVPQTLPGAELKGLTEGNMAAFQEALVSAAQDAATKGRFDQSGSVSQPSEDQLASYENDDLPFESTADDDHPNKDLELPNAINSPHNETVDDEDDDNMDDMMIAEANAEALENDDEGFYGREFGFYARSYGKNNSEMVNGGCFIPKGMEGINRSHSGRANFQEPSLTPITERSEWSNRNSLASIHAFGIPQSAHSLPSPAIADLIGQGAFEDEMSLSALMKLRRGAWGGSETSLHSSAGSQTSNSPHNIYASPRDQTANTPFPADPQAHMSSSVYSLNGSVGIAESEEDEDDFTASPTVTQNTPRKSHQQSFQSKPPFIPLAIPTYSQLHERPRAHSRNSSGAESVSYVKDPETPGKYIIEKKRTLDSGEIELIGREVLVGKI